MYEFIIVIMILISVFILKLTLKDYRNPGFIMATVWSTFMLLSMFMINNFNDREYNSFFWIITCCILFSIGNLLGIGLNNKYNASQSNNITNNKQYILSELSWNMIKLCIIIGLIRVLVELKINGFSLKNFIDLDSLINMNTTMAYNRYHGTGATSNIIMQVMLIFVYAGPLCGGYGFAYAKSKSEKILCISTWIPIILSLLISNGKAGVIASLFLWTSSYLVADIEKNNKYPKLNVIKVIKTVIPLICILILLYISMILRIGEINQYTSSVVKGKFTTYALGHMKAFDYWFSNYAGNIETSFGSYTLLGLADLIGLATKEQGVFTEIVYIDNGSYTNVYTAFRGIISDFGIIGGILFFGVVGVLTGYSYQNIRYSCRNKLFSKLILAAMYFFTLYSMIISPWTYISYILAFLVFAVYMYSAFRL